MQLKREAKLLTVIGLNTKHADCRIIFMYIHVQYVCNVRYFSELIKNISPTYIFLIYILSHHKIPAAIGLDAKVFLIQH